MSVAPFALARRGLIAPPLLVAARPRQWTKNLVLFGGILFAGKLDDVSRWGFALAAVAAFCAVSSAAYLVNDVHDAAADRRHPTKRLRPVASGELAPRTALAAAAALVLLGLAIGAALGAGFLVYLVAYGALQAAYTGGLKRVPGLDVAAIALGFVLRAVGGTTAVHVHTSHWILVCTALLASFLGFSKRRGERVLIDAARAAGRSALRWYSLARLDVLVWTTALATVGAYLVYAVTAHDSLELLVTVPFVVAGLGRYLVLVYRRDEGEEPDRVLLDDPAILCAVVAWAFAAATVIGVS